MSITATQDLQRPILGEAAPGVGTLSATFVITRSIDPFRSPFGGFQTITRALWVDSDLELVLDGAPTGLVGTLTVEIITFDGSLVVFGPTTAGIEEVPPGTGRYVASVTSPPVGHYFVVWSDGATTARGELTVVDESGAGTDTLTHVMHGDHWPDSTVVSVYPAAAWPDGAPQPAGEVVTTANVVDGSATFFGLTPRIRYVAWADGVGVRFMPRPFISREFSDITPGAERQDVIEEKLTTFELTVPTFSSVADEAATRANVDAALSARLDQLEAAAGGPSPEARLVALEAAVLELQEAVSAGALGAVWQ